MIEVIPAVDVASGRVAWAYPDGTHGDPVKVALDWQRRGATRLHLVDLDVAYRRGENHPLIEEIIRRVDIPVQLSGGIAEPALLQHGLDAGADRIVIGTFGLARPGWVEEAVATMPARLAVSLDVRGDRLIPRGSEEPVGELLATVARLDAAGCERYVVTDIDRDGALSGPNLDLLRTVHAVSGARLLSSGGTASLDDIHALARLCGVESVIVGKALYTGAITFEDAFAD